MADFDHDGRPEIYLHGLIFDAIDGTMLVDLSGELNLDTTAHTLAFDLFPDDACPLCSGLELVGSSSVWAVDVTTGAYELAGRYPVDRCGTLAVVDWNGDGLLDVVTNSNSFTCQSPPEIFVWDPRLGTALTPVYVHPGDYSSSVPLVADFDGDLELEIAFIANDQVNGPGFLRVLDHDFSILHDIDQPENSQWTSALN